MNAEGLGSNDRRLDGTSMFWVLMGACVGASSTADRGKI